MLVGHPYPNLQLLPVLVIEDSCRTERTIGIEGKAVVIADATAKRLADTDLYISALSLTEVKSLEVKKKIDGFSYASSAKFSTFEEVLTAAIEKAKGGIELMESPA